MSTPKQIYVITQCVKQAESDDYNTLYCSIGAGFAQASHAKAMGREVHIFLEASGVNWAFKNYKPPVVRSCFNPEEFFQRCLSLDVKISACSGCLACHEHRCELPVEKVLSPDELYPEIEVTSFTSLQDDLSEACNIFTF